MKKIMGIDIGGTKIFSGILNSANAITFANKQPSDTTNKNTMFESVCDSIDQVFIDAKLSPADVIFGVGVPGAVDRQRGIAIFQNNLPWTNFPLKEKLLERYPNVETITIDNDVSQAARAEWARADLTSTDTLVFLTISTGIACSIVQGGKILSGSGFAGEIGLLPVATSKGSVRFENVASGPAIEQSAVGILSEKTMSAASIFEQYYLENPLAEKVISEWIENVAQGIYAIICIIDPQKIILGGSVIKMNPKMLPLIQESLKRKVIKVQQNALNRIEISTYQNDSGVIGAALSARTEIDLIG